MNLFWQWTKGLLNFGFMYSLFINFSKKTGVQFNFSLVWESTLPVINTALQVYHCYFSRCYFEQHDCEFNHLWCSMMQNNQGNHEILHFHFYCLKISLPSARHQYLFYYYNWICVPNPSVWLPAVSFTITIYFDHVVLLNQYLPTMLKLGLLWLIFAIEDCLLEFTLPKTFHDCFDWAGSLISELRLKHDCFFWIYYCSIQYYLQKKHFLNSHCLA